MKIFDRIGSALPHFYVKSLEDLLYHTSIKLDAKTVAGRIFIYSLLTCAIAALIAFALKASVLIIVIAPLVTFFAFNLLAFSILTMVANNRAKQFERNFPEALSLIAANLRAGMTVEKAILSAAKPEFGPLEDEMHEMGKDIVGGVPIGNALLNMGERVRSETVKQTMRLITEGIKSGGSLESLLSEIADDLRSFELLKEDVKANLAMYTMFIIFAACVAAPVIYGISSKFVDFSMALQKPIMTETTQIPVGLSHLSGTITVTPFQVNVFYFSIITLVAIFASLIYGLITEGRIKFGIKRMPIFIGLGVGIFILARFLINLLFLV